MQPVYTEESGVTGAVSERATFMCSTYLYLAAAILGFTLLSALLYSMGVGVTMLRAMGTSQAMWLLFLGAFMVVGWFASSVADKAANVAAQRAALAVYVLAETLIFAPLFAVAEVLAPNAVPAAALLTLLLCVGLTWTAFTAKTDFSFLGGILRIVGLCALGAIIASVIFGFTLGVWFSAAMIVFAGGAVLYDTSYIMRHYPSDRPAGAALHLFASIALLFWYVLRLLMQIYGGGRN